ncbi:MAG: germination protein YpeB [Clostridia bacterium]|nr:germination protein YpeB [Clostridia bacterium]
MDQNKITSVDYEQEKQDSVSKVNQDKNTKKKSNAQKAIPPLVVAVVSLLIILTCVLIAYYQVYSSSKQNANVLEGVYTSSYYSMVDNVNNLSVDLAKYSTLSTAKAKTNTIQDMMIDCNYILAGLSVLPIDEENVVSATKFFNQVNGLCESYLNILNENKTLTTDQELMFDKIALVVGKIKANFNTQNEGMYDTGFNFVDASIFDNTGMNELSTGMGDLTDSSIEYPSMIFDGPFSTALETKEVKGLPEKEVSQEEAYDYLKNTVYKNRDVEIKFEQETNGDIATYDFSVDIEGKDFNAQVSKRGALLITISGYAEGGDPIMSKEQGLELAKTFANNIGFENTESVWVEVNENVAYINLAPVENNVIMYPDLVKVKVDLTAQDIIGFEAVNYALNHVDRSPEFNASESDAESLLGFDYNILETNKTVIRLDSGKEISAYEFITERIDGTYFYYIDANTLEIAKTMKLVTVKNVEKLI